MLSQFLQALTAVAIASYVVVAWWCVVAYAEDARAGRPKDRARVDLLTVLGLVVLSLVAFATRAGELVDAVLSAIAVYRLIEGPKVKRSDPTVGGRSPTK